MSTNPTTPVMFIRNIGLVTCSYDINVNVNDILVVMIYFMLNDM